MTALPRDPSFDASVAFLSDGYRFIEKRCRRLGTDAFTTRLMLRPAVCVRGREAAAMFYSGERFTRRGAMPRTTLKLLQDEGSVQALDDEAHACRKEMFMAMMTPDRIAALAHLFRDHWHARDEERSRGAFVLHEEARTVLTAAASDWAGLPVYWSDFVRRREELGAMIDEAGTFGPKHWRARLRRRRSEAWAARTVRAVRQRRLHPPHGSPLRLVADHRDAGGGPLTLAEAAVEILNVLRPIVAVGRFITFAGLALHDHPEWRERLRREPDLIEPFVQEVRRLAPFFPVVGGLVREPFEWRGRRFRRGEWVVLDLYGTNRDPQRWREPETFRPERFVGRSIDPWEMVPQGGGDFIADHRCPGEWITIALMKEAVAALAAAQWSVPDQDLSVDLSRIPALPASGLVLDRWREPDRLAPSEARGDPAVDEQRVAVHEARGGRGEKD